MNLYLHRCLNPLDMSKLITKGRKYPKSWNVSKSEQKVFISYYPQICQSKGLFLGLRKNDHAHISKSLLTVYDNKLSHLMI